MVRKSTERPEIGGYSTRCGCGRELVIKNEVQSSGPNNTWTCDVPYVVAEAQCSEGHTPYLLKRRGTLHSLFESIKEEQ
jgi:hypothetical protein